MLIRVTLPRDRRQLGTLQLVAGDLPLLTCPCYGKADSLKAAETGNPSRDPLQRNGDTPTGTYRGTVEPRILEPERSYGKWPPIRLNPTGGDALKAMRNGRRGLLIHGGHLSATGGLRPANGCVRVEDKHMNALLSALKAASLTEVPIEITEVAS